MPKTRNDRCDAEQGDRSLADSERSSRRTPAPIPTSRTKISRIVRDNNAASIDDKPYGDRAEESDSSYITEGEHIIEPLERQVSRPGAFFQRGPARRRNDSDDDVEVGSADHEDDTNDSSRELFEDEERTVVIRATLVEEDDQQEVDNGLQSTPPRRTGRDHRPPLAHAEPWNEFIASAAATRQHASNSKLEDDDGNDLIAESIHSDVKTQRNVFCLMVMLFFLASGVVVMFWIQPKYLSSQNGPDPLVAANAGNSSAAEGDDDEDTSEANDGLFEDFADAASSIPSSSPTGDIYLEESNAPSMAPTIQEPLLRRKDRYSHYVVQWGMQTECKQARWPPLELTCKSASSVVHVIEQSTSSERVAFNNENNGGDIQCKRLGSNLVECGVDEGLQATAGTERLFGSLLVVCAVEEDDDGNAPPRALDLQARIAIGEYAQECDTILPSNETQTEQPLIEVKSGGYMTPWLTMGRVCPDPSIDRNMFENALRYNRHDKNGKNRLLGDPDYSLDWGPKWGGLRGGGGGGNGGPGGDSEDGGDNGQQNPMGERRGGNGNGHFTSEGRQQRNGSFDANSLFIVDNRMLCEQGRTTTLANTEKSICFDHSTCESTQVCSRGDPNSCSPGSCSVASGTVSVSDMAGMMIDLDTSKYKCWYDNVLPGRWVRSLARGTPAPTFNPIGFMPPVLP